MALIDEKENYHGIFDHLVEGIFRTTPDRRFLLANQALARLCGYESPAELKASIRDIENLVKLIVDRKVKAVFVESSVNPRNLKSIIEGCAARGHTVAFFC